MAKRKYRLIDLFAGAGGLTLGFTDDNFGGGFECIFGVDNDKAAVETHNLNFGRHSICQNIEEWIASEQSTQQTLYPGPNGRGCHTNSGTQSLPAHLTR